MPKGGRLDPACHWLDIFILLEHTDRARVAGPRNINLVVVVLFEIVAGILYARHSNL
jgi:hypothetical protein